MKDAVIGGFKSKTIWFGAAVAILGVVQSTLPTLTLTPSQSGLAGMIIGVIVILLRTVTTGSLSDKVDSSESDAAVGADAPIEPK